MNKKALFAVFKFWGFLVGSVIGTVGLFFILDYLHCNKILIPLVFFLIISIVSFVVYDIVREDVETEKHEANNALGTVTSCCGSEIAIISGSFPNAGICKKCGLWVRLVRITEDRLPTDALNEMEKGKSGAV